MRRSRARPWLFLDFDGVLNPSWKPNSGTKALRLTGYGDHEKTTVAGYRIIYSPTIINDIRSLEVDVVWASTWVNDPDALDALCAALSIPTTWRRLPSANQSDRSTCGKAEAVDTWLSHDMRPFIWIDDEIGVFDRRLASSPTPSLVLKPDATWGLNQSHISTVRSFCAQHTVSH